MPKATVIVQKDIGKRGGPGEDFENYPPDDEVLGVPASLEIEFYNLFTNPTDPDDPDCDTYEDLDAAETDFTVTSKTVSLTQGIYSTRQQTDYFNYVNNDLVINPSKYEELFGPDNPHRFRCEPLEPIITEDPDTDPPNIKVRDINLRWDGIGVKTPMFHVELVKDKPKAYSDESYKKTYTSKSCNNDTSRGLDNTTFAHPSYDIPRKWSDGKVKKKTPLKYVIDNIMIDKAHLSIEEIESASHCVTSQKTLSDNLNYPVPPIRSIPQSNHKGSLMTDSVEGIFYNKFDTFLCKDRLTKVGTDTIEARYKITTEPRYDADPYEKPILKFSAGGTLKVKAYMVPRNWWYYARFYSPGVIEELGPRSGGSFNNGLQTRCWGYSGDPGSTGYAYVRNVARPPIANYTNIFSFWSRPPHDFRLPERNDNIVGIWDYTKGPDEYDKVWINWVTAFRNFMYDEGPEEDGYDAPFYNGLLDEDDVTYLDAQGCNGLNDDVPTWDDTCFGMPLHDPGCEDNVWHAPEGINKSISTRGNLNEGVQIGTYNYLDSGKYGFLEGGRRGLFLYNFAANIKLYDWEDRPIVTTNYMGWIWNYENCPTERSHWWIKNDDVIPLAQHTVIFHKTPTGCVEHFHTRPNWNEHVGVSYPYNSWNDLADPLTFRTYNQDHRVMYATTLTPPTGGIWLVDPENPIYNCGIQYPDENPAMVQDYRSAFDVDPLDYDPPRIHPEYRVWPKGNRRIQDGNLYDEDEVDNFGKLWTKITSSNMYKENNTTINNGIYPADNVPFITGVAGAKAESLVAILDVDGKIYYIWREIDEEDGTFGTPSVDMIPTLPMMAYSNSYKEISGVRTYYWYPLFGCGEIYSEYYKEGNLQTMLDDGDKGFNGDESGHEFPGMYRIITRIMHHYPTWNTDPLYDNFDTYMSSFDNFLGASNVDNDLIYAHTSEVDTYANWEPPTGFQIKTIENETILELEMPVYMMTYRERALYNDGPQATRWAGSFNKLRDGTLFTVTAANRNKDVGA